MKDYRANGIKFVTTEDIIILKQNSFDDGSGEVAGKININMTYSQGKKKINWENKVLLNKNLADEIEDNTRLFNFQVRVIADKDSAENIRFTLNTMLSNNISCEFYPVANESFKINAIVSIENPIDDDFWTEEFVINIKGLNYVSGEPL